MRIKLGTRLNTVLSLIDGGGAMADVGTDHGKLPVAALLTGKAARAVAIDISDKSLAKARILAEQEGVQLHCIVGDGLTPLKKDDADTIVIAGMGALEIIKILEEAPCKFSKYLFVPHKNAYLLRKYLKEKNVRILHDITVKEGNHFYFVIEALPSLPWEEKNLYVGEEGEAFEEYRNYRLNRIEQFLAQEKNNPALVEEKEALINATASRNC